MIDITRRFEIVSQDGGTTSECTLRLFDSRPCESGRDWQVCFTITGIEPRFAAPCQIYGIDALQALFGALTVARAVLESSLPYVEGRLTWCGSSALGLDVDRRAP